jgi:hypothetical protein
MPIPKDQSYPTLGQRIDEIEQRIDHDKSRESAIAFWEKVFLSRVGYYRANGWDGSSCACAAMDADGAVAEWQKRFAKG